jgi:hypothetical protein
MYLLFNSTANNKLKIDTGDAAYGCQGEGIGVVESTLEVKSLNATRCHNITILI